MKNYFKRPKFLQWLVLFLCVAALAFCLGWLFRDFMGLRRAGYMRRGKEALAANPGQIRTWMTFRYINLVFHLPADYLKDALDVADARYPNLSISSLAKSQKTDGNQILQKTIKAVEGLKSVQ